MAATFLKKDGDISEVLRTMLRSPEFWAPEAYRAKVKTPLEFVASTLRATGADVEDAGALAEQLKKMGMPLFEAQPPTGYSMKAETWVSSSALLERMNFSLALAAGKVRGTQVDRQAARLSSTSTGPADTLTLEETKLLGGDVSQQTHATVLQQIGGTGDAAHSPNMAVITGLLLGSPEFQRR